MFNTHSGKMGEERLWDLDLAPLILNAEEWQHLEQGVLQRARLFNAILSDLYAGSQRLLRDGFIPPPLVYANPRFLRPCRGIRVPDNLYLNWYAGGCSAGIGWQLVDSGKTIRMCLWEWDTCWKTGP